MSLAGVFFFAWIVVAVLAIAILQSAGLIAGVHPQYILYAERGISALLPACLIYRILQIRAVPGKFMAASMVLGAAAGLLHLLLGLGLATYLTTLPVKPAPAEAA